MPIISQEIYHSKYLKSLTFQCALVNSNLNIVNCYECLACLIKQNKYVFIKNYCIFPKVLI